MQPSRNFYLQDDWKVRRNLSFNLGLRFEYQTPFQERYNQIAYFDPAGTEPLTGRKGVLTNTSADRRYRVLAWLGPSCPPIPHNSTEFDTFSVVESDEEETEPQTFRRESAKIGRNEPCPCGSGLKHKRCCGNSLTPLQARAA